MAVACWAYPRIFLLRVEGVSSLLAWLAIVVGVVLLVPFVLWEMRHADPLIDVRMFASPALGPVFITAGLFGVSVLGAQAPLSTFARTDPSVYGYGLGVSSGLTSLLIGAYVLSLMVGALTFPQVTKLVPPRWALIVRACWLESVPVVPSSAWNFFRRDGEHGRGWCRSGALLRHRRRRLRPRRQLGRRVLLRG